MMSRDQLRIDAMIDLVRGFSEGKFNHFNYMIVKTNKRKVHFRINQGESLFTAYKENANGAEPIRELNVNQVIQSLTLPCKEYELDFYMPLNSPTPGETDYRSRISYTVPSEKCAMGDMYASQEMPASFPYHDDLDELNVRPPLPGFPYKPRRNEMKTPTRYTTTTNRTVRPNTNRYTPRINEMKTPTTNNRNAIHNGLCKYGLSCRKYERVMKGGTMESDLVHIARWKHM